MLFISWTALRWLEVAKKKKRAGGCCMCYVSISVLEIPERNIKYMLCFTTSIITCSEPQIYSKDV